jgi:hypothetical protein
VVAPSPLPAEGSTQLVDGWTVLYVRGRSVEEPTGTPPPISGSDGDGSLVDLDGGGVDGTDAGVQRLEDEAPEVLGGETHDRAPAPTAPLVPGTDGDAARADPEGPPAEDIVLEDDGSTGPCVLGA